MLVDAPPRGDDVLPLRLGKPPDRSLVHRRSPPTADGPAPASTAILDRASPDDERPGAAHGPRSPEDRRPDRGGAQPLRALLPLAHGGGAGSAGPGEHLAGARLH